MRHHRGTKTGTTGGDGASGAALLRIEALSVDYKRGWRTAPLRAVDDVSFDVDPGEAVGIVGESGSGKTTLAMATLGLLRPASGQIAFGHRDLLRPGRAARRELGRELQAVFQDPTSSLNPARTIFQTVSEPLGVHERLDRADTRARVDAMLEKVGLPASAAERYPGSLSGGQRQRVAIARALIVSPRLIVCDEVVSALDLSVQAQILNLLRDLQRELGVAYLFVSHDIAVVRYLCSRLVVMYRGGVMETGATEEICASPRHPYTQALLAAVLPDALGRGPGVRAASERAPRSVTLDREMSCPYAGRCPHVMPRCLSERPVLRQASDTGQAACHLITEPAAAGTAPML